MKLSRRVETISPSATISVMQETQKLRAQGADIIDLGPGEPDFPTPEPIKAVARQALAQNFTRYTASSGIQELRQAVANRLNRLYGSRFGSENVVITCGAKHAIYDVCMACFEEGDEVLIPAPYWVTFPEVVRLAGATPRSLVTRAEDDFVLHTSAVKSKVAESTRGLIINSPNNPTGAVIPAVQMESLTEFCRNSGVFLLSDETYDLFVYDGYQHTSLASLVDPSDDFYAIVGSASKTFSMTGWRIGFCVGNPTLMRKIGAFQSHQSGNPNSIAQKAAVAAFDSGLELIEEMRQEYARRRTLVLDRLAEIPGFSCPRPNGAFYAFPNVSQALENNGISNSVEFSKFLIRDAGVATVPGSAFGMEGYIRLSYATSTENLREALSRIRRAVTQGG